MAIPTLLELAQAGAHFGHHRSSISPKAKRFIYTIKRAVALIDLEETQKRLLEAQKVLNDYLREGKTVLFVGTKRSLRGIIRTIAESVDAPYVNDRWLGGFLTNFSSFRQNLERVSALEEQLSSGSAKVMSKSEKLRISAKLQRAQRFLEGVRQLKERPDLLVLASASQDKIALSEARQIGIPVIAIADTDVNPELITYPIPANDDAPKAIELILNCLISPALSPSKTKEGAKKTAKAVAVGKASKPVRAKTVRKGKTPTSEQK